MSKQLDAIDSAYGDINSLYNQRMSENPMQKAYAQSLVTQFADQLKESNQRNAAMVAVGGGMTAEQLAAQKASNAHAMSGVANVISQNAESQQSAYDQMKVGATQNLTTQRVATLDREAQRKADIWGHVIDGIAKVASSAAGSMGGAK